MKCYLVAKNVNKHGCVAIQVEHGRPLVDLLRKAEQQVDENVIQLIEISRPSAYGEYAPYNMCDDQLTFLKKAATL